MSERVHGHGVVGEGAGVKGEPGAESSSADPHPRLDVLQIQEYLKAAIEASKRTRFVTLMIAITSVLVLVGLVNSFKGEWMLERLWALSDPHNKYVETKIGKAPAQCDFLVREKPPLNSVIQSYSVAVVKYDQAYDAVYKAMVGAYVDRLSTKVPLFGFSVDSNDLGMVGGLAFIIILLMYILSLIREAENVRMAREQARLRGQQKDFYDALSMWQVLNIPVSRELKQSEWAWVGHVICATPLFLIFLSLLVDLSTHDVATMISSSHSTIQVCVEALWVTIIIFLTRNASLRLSELHNLWTEWHKAASSAGA
jgi:hypothetical protein